MPDVRPFRAWRYDSAIAGSLDHLICPPYDVISPTAAQSYLDRDARNVIHLELGPGAPDADAPDNRYRRAAGTLDRWVADGAVRQDSAPCLYVYEQRFALAERCVSRLAFFASVRLTPWSQREVLPHEVTLAAPKADRMALLEATRANISPIFALCDSGLAGISSLLSAALNRIPDAEAVDDDGGSHRLWAIADTALIDAVTRDVAARPLYIADGHHRYETALAYAGSHPDDAGTEGAGYVLMAISPVDDPGLVVLPTHRLLRDLDEEALDYALARLHEHFEVSVIHNVPPARPLLSALADASEQHALGLYTAGLARLLLPRRNPADALESLHPALRTLDVSALQTLIFEDLLGLSGQDLLRQSNIDYMRDAEEALRRVDEGSHQAAFLLNGTPPEAVLAVARAGAQMPQKSTYFYPKLATGMVLRRLAPHN